MLLYSTVAEPDEPPENVIKGGLTLPVGLVPVWLASMCFPESFTGFIFKVIAHLFRVNVNIVEYYTDCTA